MIPTKDYDCDKCCVNGACLTLAKNVPGGNPIQNKFYPSDKGHILIKHCINYIAPGKKMKEK